MIRGKKSLIRNLRQRVFTATHNLVFESIAKIRCKSFSQLFLVWISLWATSSSRLGFAQEAPLADDTETSRGIALGEGLRATAASTSALAYNPANLPVGKLYHLEGFGSYLPDEGQYSLGAAVVDSMTSAVAAGFSLRGILDEGAQAHSGLDGRLGIGFPISEMVSVGVSGRYIKYRLHDDESGEDVTLTSGFTMDGAVRISVAEALQLAALAHNFIDKESALVPVLLGGSAVLQLDSALQLGSDVLFDMSTFDEAKVLIGGGIEYLTQVSMPLRAGYSFDAGRQAHSVTGGIGYVDDKVGLDLSLRQQVSGGDSTEIMAAFRFFVM